MDAETANPWPSLVLPELIDLTPDAAAALARAHGVERMRIREVVDGVIGQSIDMAVVPDRLDLAVHDGRVVFATFPVDRSAGVWPTRPSR